MSTKKKIQYKDYADYLKSDKWKQVKEDYKLRATDLNLIFGDCFFCKTSDNIQHHHWRYEKDWNNDNADNLMQVCSGCHNKLHNSLRHNSTHYQTYNEYVSDAASVLISASYLEGFADGEGMQEKERTDESNAFIDHSNDVLSEVNQLKIENDSLTSILRCIFESEGFHYKYTTGANNLESKDVDMDLDFVDMFCPALKASYFSKTFDKAIDAIKRGF